MLSKILRMFFWPAIPLIFLGGVFFLLGVLIFIYPELLAYFVAIFLLLQGGFLILTGLYYWLFGRSQTYHQRTRPHYHEVWIED